MTLPSTDLGQGEVALNRLSQQTAYPSLSKETLAEMFFTCKHCHLAFSLTLTGRHSSSLPPRLLALPAKDAKTPLVCPSSPAFRLP